MKTIPHEVFQGKEHYKVTSGDVLFNNTNSEELVGKTCIITQDIAGGFPNHITRIRVRENICIAPFLAISLHSAWRRGAFLELSTRWIGQAGINVTSLSAFRLPLPPLEVQREIVEEIEGFQKVIDGARAVVESYRPHVVVDPEWPLASIKSVATVQSGFGFPLAYQGHRNRDIPFLKVSDMNLQGNEVEITSWNNSVSDRDLKELKASSFPVGTVIFPKIGAAIATNKKRILTRVSTYDNNVIGIVPDTERLLPRYLHSWLLGFDLSKWASNAQPPSMRKTVVEGHEIPLPSLADQQSVVEEIESEYALVAANRELIDRFEKKIEAAIARAWQQA